MLLNHFTFLIAFLPENFFNKLESNNFSTMFDALVICNLISGPKLNVNYILKSLFKQFLFRVTQSLTPSFGITA